VGGELQHVQASAKELVALQCDVIVGRSTPVVAALLKETRTIPIVFVVVVDPVGSGFTASLARPGGNVTGFQNYEFTMGGKWLELLKQVAPHVTRFAMIYNPTTVPYEFVRQQEAIGPSLGLQPVHVPVRSDNRISCQAPSSSSLYKRIVHQKRWSDFLWS
jgi:putative ABC transport system substrate-binding protein